MSSAPPISHTVHWMRLPGLWDIALDSVPDEGSLVVTVNDTPLTVPHVWPQSLPPASCVDQGQLVPGLLRHLDQLLALLNTQHVVQSEGQQVVLLSIDFR